MLSRNPIPTPGDVLSKIEAERDAVFIREFLKAEGRDEAAAATAYRRAGYVNPLYPVSVAAEMVLQRPEIQKALAKAREHKRNSVSGDRSVESWMTDLDAVFESALQEKDHSAAVNAKRAQAQVLGWMEQAVTITHKMELGTMSDDQLLRIINKQQAVLEGEYKDVTPKGIGHMKADGLDSPAGG